MRQYINGNINENAGDDIVQCPDTATLGGADDNAVSGTLGFVTTTSAYYKLDRSNAGPADPTHIKASQGGFWVFLF